MSRKPSQGAAAISRDVQYLMTVKLRIAQDPKRTDVDRKRLQTLLNEIITLLLNTKRDAPVSPSAKKI